jgi:hypothetical protein
MIEYEGRQRGRSRAVKRQRVERRGRETGGDTEGVTQGKTEGERLKRKTEGEKQGGEKRTRNIGESGKEGWKKEGGTGNRQVRVTLGKEKPEGRQ